VCGCVYRCVFVDCVCGCVYLSVWFCVFVGVIVCVGGSVCLWVWVLVCVVVDVCVWLCVSSGKGLCIETGWVCACVCV
jgi:hypothetical protein